MLFFINYLITEGQEISKLANIESTCHKLNPIDIDAKCPIFVFERINNIIAIINTTITITVNSKGAYQLQILQLFLNL